MSFSPRNTPSQAFPHPLPLSLSYPSLSTTTPVPATSPTSSSALSSPTRLSKKRLRPQSASGSDLRQRGSDADHSEASPSPVSGHDVTTTPSPSAAPSPATDKEERVDAAPSSTPFASTKRRAASDTSLASLDKGAGEERPGNLQTLLAESSDDDDDEEDEDEEGEEEEEEEEKSPPRLASGALTPLTSMANAASAAAAALSPLAGPHPSPHLSPHTLASLADSPSEFSAQLFVIYMPKANFKRFVISSLNTTIIRASKGEKQPVPRMNFPSLHSARPVIPPLTSPTSSSSPSAASPPSGKPLSSSPSSSADEFTYNVSMEDVLSCLEAHGVRYNPSFMWMDLSDFGARFVQQMMADSPHTAAVGSPKRATAVVAEEAQAKSSDQYGGLWYNVIHKSHLVVNHFAHPFLGEGYAVVVTLDLLDSNKDQTAVSPLQMEQSQTQTITVANDTLYKATKNINEGGITAHPALLTSTSNPPSTAAPSLSPFATPLAVPAPVVAESSASGSRRKVRPVESIGEMLDRIGEYQRIRSQVKSKNKACEKLGYSKGTINAYREKVKQALQLGIDLNQVRKTKYRDFKRVLAAAHQQQQSSAGQLDTTSSSQSGAGHSAKEKASRRDEGLKAKRSNSFGDLGLALMARQDAKNGRKKGKGERQHSREEERKRSEDEEDEEAQQQRDDDDDGRHPQPLQPHDSPVQLYSRLHMQHKGRDASPSLAASALSSSSSSSSPKQLPHHLQQPMASLVSQTGFSPQPQRVSMGAQLTYLQAAPHATFTTANLPPGTTYVLNPAPLGNQQQMTTTFAPQYAVQGTQYAGPGYSTVYATTGGGVYTTAAAAPQQGVRSQAGPTYQVVGSAPVQMAQNVQQSSQQPFNTNMRFL